MSTINAKLFSKTGLFINGEDVSIDLEYGSINFHVYVLVDSEDSKGFFVIYDDEKFSVIRELDGTFLIADQDLDDLRNHAMG
jgi:hypothetical protein